MSGIHGHFILCGLGRVGWRVLEHLRVTGVPLVVIDDRCRPDDPRLQGITLIAGDCRKQEILDAAGLMDARGVLILTSEDLVSLSTALLVHHQRPELRVIVRMFNQGLIARLGKATANITALSTSALAAPLLSLIAHSGETLGFFTLSEHGPRQIAEVLVRASSPLCGRKLADLGAHFATTLVAHHPRERAPLLSWECQLEAVLRSGDRLLVCGTPAEIKRMRGRADDDSLQELLWAGLGRRLTRVLRRTFAEIDQPVKICTSLLLTVIVASTLLFYFTIQRDTLADAFYRTISLMATGADMRGDQLPEGAWQKVFVSLLRVVGVALVASFTAILTNYLVRAHLGGALEVRRIPERGHVIVVGLGNVGYRVVEELLREGTPTVVIEYSQNNPFITTVRRLGVAVIVGDASLPELLQQAHAASARAVIIVTSNDLENLEIALMVKQLNAGQRVVLRMTDSSLARTLRETANVRLALSIPDLAAPAFVAALMGDRIRSVFLYEGRLLAVIDIVVTASDGFLEGKAVRTLLVEHRLQPLAVRQADGQLHPQPLDAILQVGDCLTGVLTLSDLQHLLQSEHAGKRVASAEA